MASVAHAQNPPEQAHVIELNYGGDVNPVAYRAEETVQQVIQHGIDVFHIAAQPHQLGLFLNGTQLDPANRYPSVRALADDVRRFLNGEPVSVLPEGGLRKAGRWLARHRMTTVAIVNALIAMPGVRDCAVFGIPDAEFGERLCACIEPETGAQLSANAVQAFLRDRLANFKVPKDIQFLDALPREATGKIFKRKLREPYWAGRNSGGA